MRPSLSSKPFPHPRMLITLLALGVVGVEHALHASAEAPASVGQRLMHLLSDATLSLPLVALAVAVASILAARFRVPRPPSAAAIAALGLVPASAVHAALDASGVAGLHTHATAAGHAWSATHALGDCIPAFFAALAIATLALPREEPARWTRRALRMRIAVARIPRARIALALSMLVVAFPARLPVAAAAFQPFTAALPIPPERTDANISIEMREADVQILPGTPTKMWTYDGIFPGPTIRRPSGQTTNVTFVNHLPVEAGSTTVHHHGNHSAPSEDGHPSSYLIGPGEQRTYTYDFMEGGVPERAAMQWYHDHRMDVTGRNVWNGLAGMVLLDDAADAALDLPRGQFDVPLMIVDRKFDGDNQLVYDPDPAGMRGDRILVNGAIQPRFDVADRTYRLRLFNASNVTEIELGFADATPMTQIATESGLLPGPVTRTRIRLGPAERAEVVVSFAGRPLGETVILKNWAGGGPLRDVMQFARTLTATGTTPPPPASLRPLPADPDPSLLATRVWTLDQTQTTPLVWTINNQAYDPARIDARPVIGSAERWIFVNTTNVNHWMHIHDVDWRLVSRLSSDPYPEDSALAEQGLKETFVVRPFEVVVIQSRFTDHLGEYVFHCHVLEHEDRAMMAQFSVRPAG